MLLLTTVLLGTELVEKLPKRPRTVKPRSQAIRRAFGNQQAMKMSIPTVTAAYNNKMNAVDRADQLRASEGYDHGFRRGGWQAIAWTSLR